MPVRKFATTDSLTLSIGACNLTGALTYAFLAYRERELQDRIVGNNNSSGTTITDCYLDGSNHPSVGLNNAPFGTPVSTVSVLKSRWVLTVVSKAAGEVKAKAFCYDFTAGSWSEGEAGTNMPNAETQATGTINFGNARGEHFEGKLAAAAEWAGTALTRAQAELLKASSLEGWLRATTAPSGLWLFNQKEVTTAVNDKTAGGANQTARTGTTVVEEEPPMRYTPSPPFQPRTQRNVLLRR